MKHAAETGNKLQYNMYIFKTPELFVTKYEV